MSELIKSTKPYHVRFVCIEDDREAWEVSAICTKPSDVINLVAACCAYNSGDECECYINGEKVMLDHDWGLVSPE